MITFVDLNEICHTFKLNLTFQKKIAPEIHQYEKLVFFYTVPNAMK